MERPEVIPSPVARLAVSYHMYTLLNRRLINIDSYDLSPSHHRDIN